MNRYELEGSGVAVEPAPGDGSPSGGGATLVLADRLFEVLPRTVRRMRHETRARFGRNLSVPQVRAVMFLRRHPGTSLSGLADHLGISRPAASIMVNALVSQGLAMRSPDPDERRRIRLSLTDDGTTTAVSARTAARGWLSGALGDLDPADRATLASAVSILDRLTEMRP